MKLSISATSIQVLYLHVRLKTAQKEHLTLDTRGRRLARLEPTKKEQLTTLDSKGRLLTLLCRHDTQHNNKYNWTLSIIDFQHNDRLLLCVICSDCVYSEYRKLAHCAEYRDAEYHYAVSRYAECNGPLAANIRLGWK